jgi:hypothetical protein
MQPEKADAPAGGFQSFAVRLTAARKTQRLRLLYKTDSRQKATMVYCSEPHTDSNTFIRIESAM